MFVNPSQRNCPTLRHTSSDHSSGQGQECSWLWCPFDDQRQAMGDMASPLMKVDQLRACFDPNVFICGLSIHGSHFSVFRGSELHFNLDKSKQVSRSDRPAISLSSPEELGLKDFPTKSPSGQWMKLRLALGFGSFQWSVWERMHQMTTLK
jgi:hypothetical protein